MEGYIDGWNDADSLRCSLNSSFPRIFPAFGPEVVMQIFWTIFALLLPSTPQDAKHGQACGEELK